MRNYIGANNLLLTYNKMLKFTKTLILINISPAHPFFIASAHIRGIESFKRIQDPIEIVIHVFRMTSYHVFKLISFFTSLHNHYYTF